MGREIKFRAWDIGAKRMYHNVMVQGDCLCIASFDFIDGDHLLIDPHIYSIAKRPSKQTLFEVMQFSGLVDRNEKEVYEGDVLQMIDSGLLYVVGFVHGAFGLESQDGFLPFITNSTAFLPKINNAVIIGNIYATPEKHF